MKAGHWIEDAIRQLFFEEALEGYTEAFSTVPLLLDQSGVTCQGRHQYRLLKARKISHFVSMLSSQ